MESMYLHYTVTEFCKLSFSLSLFFIPVQHPSLFAFLSTLTIISLLSAENRATSVPFVTGLFLLRHLPRKQYKDEKRKYQSTELYFFLSASTFNTKVSLYVVLASILRCRQSSV